MYIEFKKSKMEKKEQNILKNLLRQIPTIPRKFFILTQN